MQSCVRQVIREPAQKRFRRQVQQRRIGIRTDGNCSASKGKQPPVSHLNTVAWLSFAEGRHHSSHNFPQGDAGRAARNGVKELLKYPECDASGFSDWWQCSSAAATPPQSQSEQFRRGEIGAGCIKHALAECAGKSLLRTEQYEGRTRRLRRRAGMLDGTNQGSARWRPLSLQHSCRRRLLTARLPGAQAAAMPRIAFTTALS